MFTVASEWRATRTFFDPLPMRIGSEGLALIPVRLEVDLRCELCLTSGGCGRDQAEVAGREVCGWVQELRVVKDIVAFHADLQIADVVARQREVLGDDEVGIVDSGTVVLVPDDVAEAAD